MWGGAAERDGLLSRVIKVPWNETVLVDVWPHMWTKFY